MLSVEIILKELNKDKELKQYLPDYNLEKRILPPRQFFFDILNTVKPQYLEAKLIEYYNQKSIK